MGIYAATLQALGLLDGLTALADLERDCVWRLLSQPSFQSALVSREKRIPIPDLEVQSDIDGAANGQQIEKAAPLTDQRVTLSHERSARCTLNYAALRRTAGDHCAVQLLVQHWMWRSL